MEGRISRLEVLSGGRECGTCGFDGNYSDVEFVTEVRGIGEGEETGPEACPECGSPHVIKVVGEGSL